MYDILQHHIKMLSNRLDDLSNGMVKTYDAGFNRGFIKGKISGFEKCIELLTEKVNDNCWNCENKDSCNIRKALTEVDGNKYHVILTEESGVPFGCVYHKRKKGDVNEKTSKSVF